MYYPEGMKAWVSPVQSIEPHRILAPTRDSNLEPPGPQSRVVTTILPLLMPCHQSAYHSFHSTETACFSCSQWHCANDRQRENKRAGSTRSQCRLRHRGPSGAATSSPRSLLCPWWSTGMVRFISFKPNTNLPSQGSAVQSLFGRQQRSSRISVRTPRVHRLHWGSGGAHRRAPLGPPHVCRWHAIDGTLDDQRHSKCCYKATELHRSHPGLVQFETAPAESNKDWADLVLIKDKFEKIADLDLNLYIGPDIIKPDNVVRDLGVYWVRGLVVRVPDLWSEGCEFESWLLDFWLLALDKLLTPKSLGSPSS